MRRGRRGLLLAGVVVVLGGWWVVQRLRPSIRAVPVVVRGGTVTVLGAGFGATQGGSELLYEANGSTRAKVVQWFDNKIVAEIPAAASGGRLRVVKRFSFARLRSEAVPLVVQAAGLPSQPYGYQVPVQQDSPWPLFRRDQRNTGRSPLPASYRGDRPWSFTTGKGIFSTPIIDAAGVIYVGSADHYFYAVAAGGTQRWRFRTGEIIDSAGALPRVEAGAPATVIFPSGDGHLYRLRTDGAASNAADRLLWSFDARVSPRHDSFNNWFEGNVAIGYDGTLYAGNTNFNYYAISPDGKLRWTYPTGANAWSLAALGDDGTIYWGSDDTLVRAVHPDGKEKWTKRTLGFIAASAAIGSDGTVYIGSFDSYLYALDPETGATKWTFKTNDHIYASVALGADVDGNTDAIYVGSADGTMYALDTRGKPLWQYDTGDPIRSSPALGAAPSGEQGGILYFGSGNGKLYALDAADGTRRWSFDTTAADPELKDRNDLNASPALGRSGVYIGGEQGQLWYVPYDYCLHAVDERCQREKGEDLPADAAGLFYVTPGGSTELQPPATIPRATVITLRLIVRKRGETVAARLCNTPLLCGKDSLRVRTEPEFPLRAVKSADGRYLHLVPDGILEPDTAYRITVSGDYDTGGLHLGNLTVGGSRSGTFDAKLTFRTEKSASQKPPLVVESDRVSAFEWTRLALPLPTMMPSLNQIGFDYMDWIMGVVAASTPDARGAGRFVVWGIGGRRDERGVLVADPDTEFVLPLSGTYRGASFVLENRGFTLPVTGIPIPFNLYQIRGRFGPDLTVEPGATVYADTQVLSIPTFGKYLVLAGLANDVYKKLVVTGTYVTRPYGDAGPANKRPGGVSVTALDYEAPTGSVSGKVVAKLGVAPGSSYPLAQHRPAIVLIDDARTEALGLSYRDRVTARADDAGNLSQITLTIPPGTRIPAHTEAVVLLDVFPIYRQRLGLQ